MNLKHAYLAAFLIAVGDIAYQDIRHCHRLPWPPRIILTGMVFAILDLFSVVNEELPSVIAIGVVLAVLVNHGFVSDCSHFTSSVMTSQPTDVNWLQNPTPGDQSTSSSGAILAATYSNG